MKLLVVSNNTNGGKRVLYFFIPDVISKRV